MTDHPFPYADDVDAVRPTRGADVGAPRWVKVLGIIALALVFLVVVLQFVGGGEHGPGRHGQGGPTPSSSVVGTSAGGLGHVPPAGPHG